MKIEEKGAVMMSLTLGRVFTIILLLTAVVFANVEAFVNKDSFKKGEMVKFSITAKGDEVIFPEIKEISGIPIENVTSSMSIVSINGITRKSFRKNYLFKADKNITIPSYKVKVDGVEYQTESVNINVSGKKDIVKELDVKVELKVAKRELYLGEPVEVDLVIKLPINKNIMEYRVENLEFAGFWYELVGEPIKERRGNTFVEIRRFILTPKKAGELNIGPIFVNIAKAQANSDPMFSNDPFFAIITNNYVIWNKVPSNSVKVKVKPLPDNLELFGDFNITTKVDKRKINANEPVNLTVEVEGVGNIGDIEKFQLNIKDAVIYDSEPQIEQYLIKGELKGVFRQKFAIIADKNFTIPPIELKYFSKSKKKIVVKKSKPIDIEVIGGGKRGTLSTINLEDSKSQNSNLKSEIESVNDSSSKVKGYDIYSLISAVILGYFLGIGNFWLYRKFKKSAREKRSIPIIKEIKRAKSDRELFNILLPYSNSKEISNILDKLEENLYNNGNNKIDKDEIIDILYELEDIK
jgi:hypothetical protein